VLRERSLQPCTPRSRHGLLRWWSSDDCWSVWLRSRDEDVARAGLDRFFAPTSVGQMTTTASWLALAPQPPQPVAELLQVASLRVVASARMVLHEVSGTSWYWQADQALHPSSSKGAIPLLPPHTDTQSKQQHESQGLIPPGGVMFVLDC
jgi:hypothetical protein